MILSEALCYVSAARQIDAQSSNSFTNNVNWLDRAEEVLTVSDKMGPVGDGNAHRCHCKSMKYPSDMLSLIFVKTQHKEFIHVSLPLPPPNKTFHLIALFVFIPSCDSPRPPLVSSCLSGITAKLSPVSAHSKIREREREREKRIW